MKATFRYTPKDKWQSVLLESRCVFSGNSRCQKSETSVLCFHKKWYNSVEGGDLWDLVLLNWVWNCNFVPLTLAWTFLPTVKWAVKTLACYRPAHKRLVTSDGPRVAWFRPALPLSRCCPVKRAAVPVAWHGGPVFSLETEHLPSVVQENVHLEVTGGLWSRPACCSLSATSH